MENYISQIPVELTHKIAESLDLRDLIQISQTCVNQDVYKSVLMERTNRMVDDIINKVKQSEGHFLPIMILSHTSDEVKSEYGDTATNMFSRLLKEHAVVGLFTKEFNNKYKAKLKNKLKETEVEDTLNRLKDMEPFFDPYICEWDNFTSFVVIREDYDKESINIIKQAIQKYPKCLESLLDEFLTPMFNLPQV